MSRRTARPSPVRRLRPVPPAVAALAALTVLLVAGCAAPGDAAPGCRANERLAVVAQSVPDAAYVPCVGDLPPGWSVSAFSVDDDGTALSLSSDRAEHPVDIELRPECDITGATPTAPRDEGVRTHVRLDAISPRYAGALLDVFPGGCVVYEFDFERGPHIALMDDLQHAVRLFSRRQLDQELGRDL